MDDSTISDNNASNGGGVYISGSPEKGVIRGRLSYTNTIIADNTARLEKYGAADCVIGDYASIGTSVNNLVEDGNCSPAYSGDPLLAGLADEGGPSTGSGQAPSAESEYVPQTHALLPGSPAVDAIPADECAVARDQRGVSRPQGTGCDIGAYELHREESGAAGLAMYGGLLLGLLILIVIGGFAVVRLRRQT